MNVPLVTVVVGIDWLTRIVVVVVDLGYGWPVPWRAPEARPAMIDIVVEAPFC